MNHVKEILGGLAVVIVVLGIVGGLLFGMIHAGDKNRQKVQQMNQLCLDKGYAGWQDAGRNSDYARCVK